MIKALVTFLEQVIKLSIVGGTEKMRTDVTVSKKHRLSEPRLPENGGLVELHAAVYTSREADDGNSIAECKVLDWELFDLMA